MPAARAGRPTAWMCSSRASTPRIGPIAGWLLGAGFVVAVAIVLWLLIGRGM